MRHSHLGNRIALATILTVAISLTPTLSSLGSSATPRTSPCEPGDTEIVMGPGGAGLGHWSITLLLVDPGARTCTFKGYPTVRAFVSLTRHWVAARRTPSGYLGGLGSGQTIMPVTLTFDTVASFMIEGTDVPVGNARSCPQYVRLVAALPGWHPTANLPIDAPACSTLQVHPLVIGPTGDQR